MSTQTLVRRLSEHVDQSVTLRGWVHNKSSKGKLHFIQLRDGSGFAQCVAFKGDLGDELFEALGRLGQESSLSVTGMVKEDARAPGTGPELIERCLSAIEDEAA